MHGVQRLAYDVTLTDEHGASGREHLIYQCAGRTIVAVYGTPGMIASATPFASKGEQRLVDTIAHRLASSPQAAVTEFRVRMGGDNTSRPRARLRHRPAESPEPPAARARPQDDEVLTDATAPTLARSLAGWLGVN